VLINDVWFEKALIRRSGRAGLIEVDQPYRDRQVPGCTRTDAKKGLLDHLKPAGSLDQMKKQAYEKPIQPAAVDRSPIDGRDTGLGGAGTKCIAAVNSFNAGGPALIVSLSAPLRVDYYRRSPSCWSQRDTNNPIPILFSKF